MHFLTNRPQFFRSKPVHLVEGGALRHFFRFISVHFAASHDIFPEGTHSLRLQRAVSPPVFRGIPVHPIVTFNYLCTGYSQTTSTTI